MGIFVDPCRAVCGSDQEMMFQTEIKDREAISKVFFYPDRQLRNGERILLDDSEQFLCALGVYCITLPEYPLPSHCAWAASARIRLRSVAVKPATVPGDTAQNGASGSTQPTVILADYQLRAVQARSLSDLRKLFHREASL